MADNNVNFDEIVLDVNAHNNASCQDEDDQARKKRIKQVLRFSDGDIEEYETDDDLESTTDKNETHSNGSNVDPKTLNWGPWTWLQTQKAGGKVLQACDFAGEKIADFLGITGPKYQFEIDEYNRNVAAEKDTKEREDREMTGWYARNEDKPLQSQVISQNNVGTYL